MAACVLCKESLLSGLLRHWRIRALDVQSALYNGMHDLYRDMFCLDDMNVSFVQRATECYSRRNLALKDSVDRAMLGAARDTRQSYVCPAGILNASVPATILLAVVKQQYNTLVGSLRKFERERTTLESLCRVRGLSGSKEYKFLVGGRRWDSIYELDTHPCRQMDVQDYGGWLSQARERAVPASAGEQSSLSEDISGDVLLRLTRDELSGMPNGDYIDSAADSIARLEASLLAILRNPSRASLTALVD